MEEMLGYEVGARAPPDGGKGTSLMIAGRPPNASNHHTWTSVSGWIFLACRLPLLFAKITIFLVPLSECRVSSLGQDRSVSDNASAWNQGMACESAWSYR